VAPFLVILAEGGVVFACCLPRGVHGKGGDDDDDDDNDNDVDDDDNDGARDNAYGDGAVENACAAKVPSAEA
jgi:hypothetical protein